MSEGLDACFERFEAIMPVAMQVKREANGKYK